MPVTRELSSQSLLLYYRQPAWPNALSALHCPAVLYIAVVLSSYLHTYGLLYLLA